MKNIIAALVICVSLAVASADAEAAKRFGGGMNLGGSAPTFSQKAPAAPAAMPGAKARPSQSSTTQNQASRPAATPNAPVQKPSMMRSILGGIAGALGIAALLSLFGINGAGITSLITGLLLAAVVFFVIRMVFARRRMQPASAGMSTDPFSTPARAEMPRAKEPVAESRATEMPAQVVSGARAGSVIDQLMGGAVAATSEVETNPVDVTPADFDITGFLRTARENYIKLQKAWDTGNVIEISDFTDNDLFTAVTHQLRERKGEVYHTEVERLDNELLGIAQKDASYYASVRFTGRLVINGETEDLDETWILSKPVEGKGGWLLCGIRQNGSEA